MSVRLLRHTVFAVAMLSLAIGDRAAESVKLAVITPLSGPFALQGEDAVKQFRGIADLINARRGVIDGRPLEIVPFDGKAVPQDSLFALKEAIDQHATIVATHISTVAHTLADAIIKQNERNPGQRLLLLTFDARDPALTEEKCNF
jgi:branched-chain amino acid transport system substrate-binding protein